MELAIYYFMLVATRAAIVLLLIGAVLATKRRKHPAFLLQIVGAVFMLTVQVMDFFNASHPDGSRVATTWIWETELALGGLGILLFAIGYLWGWAMARSMIIAANLVA